MTVLFFIIMFIAIVVMIAQVSRQAQTHEDTQRELAQKLTNDELISELEKKKLNAEVMIQSMIVGDTDTYNAVLNNTYRGPWPEPRADGGYLSLYDNLRILKIAGINRRDGIGRYVGRVDCALVPEPDNEFDPEAIKVVADDRHHLGYIPADQTAFVRSLTAGEFPYKATAFIEEKEDEVDGHRFFVGFVYIKRLD